MHAFFEAGELSELSSNQVRVMRELSVYISLSLFLLTSVCLSVEGVKHNLNRGTRVNNIFS